MSNLPSQRVTAGQRTKEWKENTMDHFINFKNANGSDLRSARNNKIINYNLMNGIVDTKDILKMCDPLGTGAASFDEQFMHYDKLSPIVHELLGEESIRPDTSLVYSEAPDDLNRKQTKHLKYLRKD